MARSNPSAHSSQGPRMLQGQSQVQEQRMEQRMLQSIELLALPTMDLGQWLQAAAGENEALVLQTEPGTPGSGAFSSASAGDLDADPMAGLESAKGSLEDLLKTQLALLDLLPRAREWAEHVIEALDGRGLLTLSDQELLFGARAKGLVGEAGELGQAIAVVQGLEPRGIGGRDAVETLLLQLDPEQADYALLAALIEDFLQDLARNKLPHVAQALGIEIDRLKELLGQLRGLTLEPTASLDVAVEAQAPLVPDLIVEASGEGFEVRLASGNLAPVALDEGILALSRDREQAAELRRYLREKVERARWIVDALALRERTLLRVAGVALERQREFLRHGPGHLVPLAMGEVAELLDVHLSTVSRATSGKYVDTPWGILSLRSFFQRQSGAEDGQAGGAQDEVQRKLKALVDGEDSDAPLSDADLTSHLAAAGVQLSRRSVANLRKALGIPSSYRRRSYS